MESKRIENGKWKMESRFVECLTAQANSFALFPFSPVHFPFK